MHLHDYLGHSQSELLGGGYNKPAHYRVGVPLRSKHDREVDGPDTYPTICPRCNWEGKLRLSERPTAKQLRLKASGVIEREEARESALQYKIICPECRDTYWMLIEFTAGKGPELRVSTHPLLSIPEKMKEVELGEVFYSKEKRWWFYKQGGKTREIGPGEPSGSPC